MNWATYHLLPKLYAHLVVFTINQNYTLWAQDFADAKLTTALLGWLIHRFTLYETGNRTGASNSRMQEPRQGWSVTKSIAKIKSIR
jgi:IstB-like ATP binding protein